ncbi:MAG TPA: GNAT family protein [Armatimonadota bacterium]|nr:GNAT family protein [Armatimonadota bacterium]
MTSPILKEVPEAFETERLLIRAPRFGDGAAVNAAIQETFEELRPWMPWARQRPTVEESEMYVREAYCNFLQRKELGLLLFLKGTETLVGASGLHRIRWDIPRFEIGYWRRSGFQGQGYVTEAVRGLTVYGFEVLGARRVEIRCDARNGPSRRVAERVGYRLEGTLRSDDLSPDGEPRDTLVFSLLPEEYASLNLDRIDY